MNNKKIVMIIRIALIVVLIASMSSTVLAAATAKDPSTWTANQPNSSTMTDIIGNVLGFVQLLGSAIAVIMVVVLGIKYMVGSAEEKAEYKKTMIPYAVGAVCIFGASNISKIVYDAVS